MDDLDGVDLPVSHGRPFGAGALDPSQTTVKIALTRIVGKIIAPEMHLFDQMILVFQDDLLQSRPPWEGIERSNYNRLLSQNFPPDDRFVIQ